MSCRNDTTCPSPASVGAATEFLTQLDRMVTGRTRKAQQRCLAHVEHVQAILEAGRNALDRTGKVIRLGAYRANRPDDARDEQRLAMTNGAIALLNARCANCGLCPSRRTIYYT